ncbi:MAG: hypothetical protein J6S89_10190 [Paludibacteraceae bacterium]|nr:hypothetical protein [Paludibacteraceae bacterium]
MIAAEYAKPVEVMEYQISAPPSTYIMPVNHRKSIVNYDNQIEFRFYLIDHEDNAVIMSIPQASYHKVPDIEVTYNRTLDEIQREQACQQVTDIAKYQKNWDGYGAIRPLSECLSHALDIIGNENINLSYLSDIYPNPNGTISFEWEQDDNEIGLELGRNEFSYYACIGGVQSYNNKKRYVSEEIGRLARFISFMG